MGAKARSQRSPSVTFLTYCSDQTKFQSDMLFTISPTIADPPRRPYTAFSRCLWRQSSRLYTHQAKFTAA